ncbi:MAG: hypothetical protein WKF81_02155 [Thermomicrobiales bacterium]
MMTFVRKPLLALGLLLSRISFSALAPNAAAAQTSVDVGGTLSGGGSFSDVIIDAKFTGGADEFMRITGQPRGVATIDGEDVAIDLSLNQIVSPSDDSNCDRMIVIVIVNPIELEDLGQTLQLDQLTFDQPETDLLGGLLGGNGGNGNVICLVDDLLGGGGDVEGLADVLNDLLDDIGY